LCIQRARVPEAGDRTFTIDISILSFHMDRDVAERLVQQLQQAIADFPKPRPPLTSGKAPTDEERDARRERRRAMLDRVAEEVAAKPHLVVRGVGKQPRENPTSDHTHKRTRNCANRNLRLAAELDEVRAR
jgi:hypothetical protein